MEHYFNICTMAVSRQTLKTAPIQEGKMHFPIRRRTHNQLCKNKTLLQLSMSRYNTVERDGVKYDTANAATTEATDYRDRVKSQMQLTIAYFCCTVSFSIKKTKVLRARAFGLCIAEPLRIYWHAAAVMAYRRGLASHGVMMTHARPQATAPPTPRSHRCNYCTEAWLAWTPLPGEEESDWPSPAVSRHQRGQQRRRISGDIRARNPRHSRGLKWAAHCLMCAIGNW